MILKAMNYDTGRWCMYESDHIELGKMWIGVFGGLGDPMTQLALYEQEEEPKPKKGGDPVARRCPILLGVDVGAEENKNDVLVDHSFLHDVFRDMQGTTRKQVRIAILHKANGDEQLVVFAQPAYLMNEAGKTIEKL